MTGQINQLYSLRQTKNQGDYWQPLSHSRAAFLHITNMFVCKPCPASCVLISQRFSVSLYPSRTNMLEVLILLPFLCLPTICHHWKLCGLNARFAQQEQSSLTLCKAPQQLPLKIGSVLSAAFRLVDSFCNCNDTNIMWWHNMIMFYWLSRLTWCLGSDSVYKYALKGIKRMDGNYRETEETGLLAWGQFICCFCHNQTKNTAGKWKKGIWKLLLFREIGV